MSWSRGRAALAVASAVLPGCHPLPTYPWVDHDTALLKMSRRAERLRTIAGHCAVDSAEVVSCGGSVPRSHEVALRKRGGREQAEQGSDSDAAPKRVRPRSQGRDV